MDESIQAWKQAARALSRFVARFGGRALLLGVKHFLSSLRNSFPLPAIRRHDLPRRFSQGLAGFLFPGDGLDCLLHFVGRLGDRLGGGRGRARQYRSSPLHPPPGGLRSR